MSPDEIFAAQMWPWPDPIIKRDAMGRVLFVNAAFLQLYGGAVENWRGNVITGWMVPQAPGVPYRFETRLTNEMGDSVFDWIEYSLADGTALAIARNVTALLPSQSPPPAEHAPVQELATNVPPAHTAQTAPEAPVADNTESVPATPPQGQPQEPVHEVTQHNQAAQAEPATSEIESMIDQVTQLSEPLQEPAEIKPVYETVSKEPVETRTEAASVITETPAEAPVSEETPTPDPVSEPNLTAEPRAQVPAEREVERRALPIEDGDAVLGNNWRDAVIAKAVGAESAEQEDEVAIESENEPAAPVAAPSALEADGPLRILLAEDNAINALLTRTLLEAEGHVVDVVEDGALAVDAAKAQHYDLVFMDMRMPNMDGLESTRKIRALDNRSKSLPIIALTANAFDDDRNACFDSGMNDFMTKPVSAEELSEMVRTWTKSRDQRMAS